MEKPVLTEELHDILKAYPRERRFSLAILQDFQHCFGYIPREGFEALAGYLDMKTAPLYAMATFYKALSLSPKGKHVITVCDGTACHIRGSMTLLDTLKRTLGIGPGETSADNFFTVETVNCLGTCAISPVMMVDDTYYAKVKPDEVEKILETYRKGKTDG
jgi:NADH-quinone oxidoreductase subunit E